MIPRHHSQLTQSETAPACISRRRPDSHAAVKTANATWSEGNAFPDASTVFRIDRDECSESWKSTCGTAVGQRMNVAKPMKLRAAAAHPYEISSRREVIRAGASVT